MQELVQVVEVVVESALMRVETGRGREDVQLRRAVLAAVSCQSGVEWIAEHEARPETLMLTAVWAAIR